jgi:serine/threonine protein kinase
VTGDVVGTPAYMSPEQVNGSPADERSDIYSLGAVLFETATRRPPFVGTTIAATMYQILNVRPLPVREINPATPQGLATICAKALEKNPGDRYATMAEMADDLDLFLSDRAVKARGPSPARRAWEWCAVHRATSGGSVAAVGFLVLLLLALQAGWLTSG